MILLFNKFLYMFSPEVCLNNSYPLCLFLSSHKIDDGEYYFVINKEKYCGLKSYFSIEFSESFNKHFPSTVKTKLERMIYFSKKPI